jgi:hypothetical protein
MVLGGFMSRTHKDKPEDIKWPEERLDYNTVRLAIDFGGRLGYRRIEVSGKKTKKPRTYCHHRWWAKSPGWWVRLTMTKPQRRAGRVWEAVIKYAKDLDVSDPPQVSRRPHVYYY